MRSYGPDVWECEFDSNQDGEATSDGGSELGVVEGTLYGEGVLGVFGNEGAERFGLFGARWGGMGLLALLKRPFARHNRETYVGTNS